jgi:hypothetical protein
MVNIMAQETNNVKTTIQPATKDYLITSHAQVIRNERIPIPCWASKDGTESAVTMDQDTGMLTYKVGQVSVMSKCEPIDDQVLVTVTAQNKKLFVWDESITLSIPYESFKVLGLFGIGERLNTNTNSKPRGAFLETCFALVNGGYSAQLAKSYLAETAKEKAERIEREKTLELARFRKLAGKFASTVPAKAWLKTVDDTVLANSAGTMMLNATWGTLRDAVIEAQYTHIPVPALPEWGE